MLAAWSWAGLGCCVLASAAQQTAGGASLNLTAPQRRLQAGPLRVILPYPNPEVCKPKHCFLRIPASYFPEEMTLRESREQVEMIAVRYTEVVKDIRAEEGLTPTDKPGVRHFINYVRKKAESSIDTRDSIREFDPVGADGRRSCDTNLLTGPPGCGLGGGPSDACLTWMHIYQVFLFYEENYDRAVITGTTTADCWCAQKETPCPEEGQCWPGCAG